MREKITYEEALTILEENLPYLSKSSKFYPLIQSLGKEEELLSLFNKLTSNNDKEALIRFVEFSKPKYLSKVVNTSGVIYIYETRYIGTPSKELLESYGAIEKAHSTAFKALPTEFFTTSSTKIPFQSFTYAINYLNKGKGTKISFIIPKTDAE